MLEGYRGHFMHFLTEMIRFYAPSMKTLNLSCGPRRLDEVYHVLVPVLQARNVSLKLTVPKATGDLEEDHDDPEEHEPSTPFSSVVSEILLFKVDTEAVVSGIFSRGIFEKPTNVSIVSLHADTRNVLGYIAEYCIHLKRLMLHEYGLDPFAAFEFLRHWDSRKSKQLIIHCVGDMVARCAPPVLHYDAFLCCAWLT